MSKSSSGLAAQRTVVELVHLLLVEILERQGLLGLNLLAHAVVHADRVSIVFIGEHIPVERVLRAEAQRKAGQGAWVELRKLAARSTRTFRIGAMVAVQEAGSPCVDCTAAFVSTAERSRRVAGTIT